MPLCIPVYTVLYCTYTVHVAFYIACTIIIIMFIHRRWPTSTAVCMFKFNDNTCVFCSVQNSTIFFNRKICLHLEIFFTCRRHHALRKIHAENERVHVVVSVCGDRLGDLTVALKSLVMTSKGPVTLHAFIQPISLLSKLRSAVCCWFVFRMGFRGIEAKLIMGEEPIHNCPQGLTRTSLVCKR